MTRSTSPIPKPLTGRFMLASDAASRSLPSRRSRLDTRGNKHGGQAIRVSMLHAAGTCRGHAAAIPTRKPRRDGRPHARQLKMALLLELRLAALELSGQPPLDEVHVALVISRLGRDREESNANAPQLVQVVGVRYTRSHGKLGRPRWVARK